MTSVTYHLSRSCEVIKQRAITALMFWGCKLKVFQCFHVFTWVFFKKRFLKCQNFIVFHIEVTFSLFYKMFPNPKCIDPSAINWLALGLLLSLYFELLFTLSVSTERLSFHPFIYSLINSLFQFILSDLFVVFYS